MFHPPDNKESSILVAISMMTFNHEEYIEKAVESVMMQKTTFNYLLVIVEDCSTDNTLAICKRLKQKYPEKILLQANDTNQGQMRNAQQIFKTCYSSAAKYVALIDGDDYWIDENKLQKQVDFLEANKEYTICFHETDMLEVNGHIHPMLGLDYNCSFTINDLLKRNFIPAVSTVFRVTDSITDFKAGFTELFVYDWVLHLTNAEQGKIYYLKDCMAAYRVHAGGAWSSVKKKSVIKKYIHLMTELDQYFQYKYHTEFTNSKKQILEDYYNGTSFLVSPTTSVSFRVKRKIRRLLGR